MKIIELNCGRTYTLAQNADLKIKIDYPFELKVFDSGNPQELLYSGYNLKTKELNKITRNGNIEVWGLVFLAPSSTLILKREGKTIAFTNRIGVKDCIEIEHIDFSTKIKYKNKEIYVDLLVDEVVNFFIDTGAFDLDEFDQRIREWDFRKTFKYSSVSNLEGSVEIYSDYKVRKRGRVYPTHLYPNISFMIENKYLPEDFKFGDEIELKYKTGPNKIEILEAKITGKHNIIIKDIEKHIEFMKMVSDTYGT